MAFDSGSLLPGWCKCKWRDWPPQVYSPLHHSRPSHRHGVPSWQRSTHGLVWREGSLSEYSSPPSRPVSLRYEMAGLLLCGFNSPLWPALCPLHFWCRYGYGGVDPGALLSGFGFTPLSGWFYHSWSASLDSVCQEPIKYMYSLGCVRSAGLTSSSRQVRQPCSSAYNFRNWTGFCQSGSSPPSWEAWGLAGINCILVGSDVVQQTQAWVIDWSPPPCCESCLTWSNFLRRMIDLLCCFLKKDHPIPLNKEFHSDLQWWHQFLFPPPVAPVLFPGNTPAADIEVSSDVAGSLGFGTYVAGQCFFWFMEVLAARIVHRI